MMIDRILALLSVFTLGALLQGCSSKYVNQQPMGQPFPSVSGKNLKGKVVELPKDLSNRKAILLIGYKQNSQFDIDRWLVGLYDSKVKTPVYEVPTVVGMIPGMIAKKIDKGMKSGIPDELWASVVTLYRADAEKIARFSGNEDPLNARVLLLDENGRIIFFHDRGYSALHLRKLTGLLENEQ